MQRSHAKYKECTPLSKLLMSRAVEHIKVISQSTKSEIVLIYFYLIIIIAGVLFWFEIHRMNILLGMETKLSDLLYICNKIVALNQLNLWICYILAQREANGMATQKLH